jgi:hypothetical protein
MATTRFESLSGSLGVFAYHRVRSQPFAYPRNRSGFVPFLRSCARRVRTVAALDSAPPTRRFLRRVESGLPSLAGSARPLPLACCRPTSKRRAEGSFHKARFRAKHEDFGTAGATLYTDGSLITVTDTGIDALTGSVLIVFG